MSNVVSRGVACQGWYIADTHFPTHQVCFRSTFEGCTIWNGDVSGWDMRGALTCEKMFKGCPNFKGYGLAGWDVVRREAV